MHACMHACIHTYIHTYMHAYTRLDGSKLRTARAFCGYLPAAKALHELERDGEVGPTNNGALPVGTVASLQAPHARKRGEVSLYSC